MRSLYLFAATVLLIYSASLAQEPPKPTFEVVSIRPVPEGEVFPPLGGPGSSDPERFTAKNIRLRMLLLRAYGVKPYQDCGACLDRHAIRYRRQDSSRRDGGTVRLDASTDAGGALQTEAPPYDQGVSGI